MKKRDKYILYILSTLFFSTFLWIIHLANIGNTPQFLQFVNRFPGGDKVAHVILLTLSSFFMNMILYPKGLKIFGRTLLYGTIFIAIFITIEEFHQDFLDTRTFDLLDLACNYAGIYLGGKLLKIIRPRVSSSKQREKEKEFTFII